MRHDAYTTSVGIHNPSYKLRVTTSHAGSQDTRTDDDCTPTGRQHEASHQITSVCGYGHYKQYTTETIQNDEGGTQPLTKLHW
ncbi:hypothetical protein E2C01_101488 [Portunus trituberculatus]|uniref:Uncharacterized protein n=1 Tax=Portunus trituberculatus TaxID=210409 RepID=A0A5B7KK68_PORTR|nr:hypothetical protein [Portunus trituberculatus]